jgi:uncharacterized membrane protein YebE (DUF533 family)
MMDVKSLLESLVSTGNALKDKATAVTKEYVDTSNPETQRQMKTLGAGALLGGVAAMLLGTKTGRKISGGMLKVGSVASVGAVAYTAYQQWAKQSGTASTASQDAPIATLTGVAADERSLTILRAMVAAANADGEIDANEIAAINDQMARLDLPEDSQQWLRKEFQSPRSAYGVAALSDSPAAAAEIYAVSSVVVDHQSPQESAYMEQLRQALKLDQGFVDELKKHMR